MDSKGMTTIAVKKYNKSKVYSFIYHEISTAKMQIVQKLEMGLSTVSQNLKELEEEGLIERNGYFESTGGRKAQAIQIVPTARLSIGVGLLKNMVHLAAVDLYGNAVCTATLPISYEPSEPYYEKLGHAVEGFIDDNQIPRTAILGVSVATQGIIAPDGQSVSYGVIMDNSRMHLSDISRHLPYPCILEHDSKAAAYLELWNHKELDSAVVFLLNRNLGGAIITGRRIHQGLAMHSGSLEHICVNQDGPRCYCGSRGCLETYCSANALEDMAGMSVPVFFQTLQTENPPSIHQVWNDYLDHLAFAIRNLNMVIDSPVIISGYLAPYFTDEDISYLLNKINASSPFSLSKEQIIVGTHGQYTPAIGAALLYINQFLKTV